MEKVALLALILLFISGAAYAKASDTKTEQGNTVEQVNKAEEVGNKSCPVSGEIIDEENKVTYEYKGKIYNFCCSMCVDEFKKDPEKYIKKLEKAEESKGHEGHNEHHDHGH